jgi:hypothetical protein
MRHFPVQLLKPFQLLLDSRRFLRKDYVVMPGKNGKPSGGVQFSALKDWKVLGAMKGEPTKGHIKTYSPDQWADVARQMRETVSAHLRTAEAVSDKIAQGGEFGHTVANQALSEHPTGDDAPAAVEAAHESNPEDVRVFTPDHADAIVEAVKGVPLNKLAESMSMARALAASGPDAVQAFKVLVRQVADQTKESPDTVLEVARQIIYENAKNGGGSAETLARSAIFGPDKAGDATLGNPNPEPAGGGPGSQPGSGGTPEGAEANAGGGAAGQPRPDAILRPASPDNAESVKQPVVKVADADGLGAKEYGKLQAIAENLARDAGHEGRDAVETAADQILDEAVTVKVDGQTALFYDGQIHLQDGSTMAVPRGLMESVAKFRKAQAVETVERLRPTDAKTAQVATSVERVMRAYGIRVDRAIDILVDHFGGVKGQYKEILNGKGNVKRIITWMVADANNPSRESLVSLLHEVGHAVFARETPERQAVLHEAIQGAADEILGIKGFTEAGTLPEQQEGRLVESVAQKLVADGFNPQEAGGVIQSVWRALKDVYHGTLMAIAKMAGYPVNQDLARAYFTNRMKMTLAGDPVSCKGVGPI